MSAWEFAPGWNTPKMTKAQVRKYIADMKEAQERAKRKLEEEKKLGEWEKENLEELEKKLENLL